MNGLTSRLTYRRFAVGGRFWLYRPALLRRFAIAGALITVFAASALTLGSVALSTADASLASFVLETLRLPRILLALLTGAMLGMAGAAMQEVTRNGLADPGLIGVNEGAAVTILALVLFFPGVAGEWRPSAGLLGGAIVAAGVIVLARSIAGLKFVLIGIGVSWLLSSGISLFITMGRMSDVENALIWLSGSLHAASWADLRIAAPWAAGGLVLLVATARAGDAAALGNLAATGLGVRLRWVGALQLLAPVMLTAASTSVIGSLGFVGLIAPHLARLMIGTSQLPLIIGSATLGAALVLVADTVGRALFAPVQIPAGTVMAVLGVPFFLFILWRRRNEL